MSRTGKKPTIMSTHAAATAEGTQTKKDSMQCRMKNRIHDDNTARDSALFAPPAVVRNHVQVSAVANTRVGSSIQEPTSSSPLSPKYPPPHQESVIASSSYIFHHKNLVPRPFLPTHLPCKHFLISLALFFSTTKHARRRSTPSNVRMTRSKLVLAPFSCVKRPMQRLALRPRTKTGKSSRARATGLMERTMRWRKRWLEML